VLAGDGDGAELVTAGVGELVPLAEGDELAVAWVGDGDDDRHSTWRWCRWSCGLQVAGAPAEEVCAARAIGIVKPVTSAAATATTAMTAFMKP
jgi:hypothetical protein